MGSKNIHGDESLLDEEGRIRDDAHPWAVQLREDIEEIVAGCDSAATLDLTWRSRSMLTLFDDEDVRNTFCGVGANELRARSVSYTHLTLPTIYSV